MGIHRRLTSHAADAGEVECAAADAEALGSRPRWSSAQQVQLRSIYARPSMRHRLL
jgi:hypothetical protein